MLDIGTNTKYHRTLIIHDVSWLHICSEIGGLDFNFVVGFTRQRIAKQDVFEVDAS